MTTMSFADMGLAALKRRQYDAAINMLRQALGEDEIILKHGSDWRVPFMKKVR